MLLFLFTACSGPTNNDAMEEDAATELTVPPAFLKPNPDALGERFSLKTLQQLTAGKTPPPCHYLVRVNEFGGYTAAMTDGPGVAWDVLTVPFLEITPAAVSGDSMTAELVKVVVPDHHKFGAGMVEVNWFEATAFVDSPEKSAFPESAYEGPTIPDTCTVPEKPKVPPITMEATLSVTDPTTGSTTYERAAKYQTKP